MPDDPQGKHGPLTLAQGDVMWWAVFVTPGAYLLLFPAVVIRLTLDGEAPERGAYVDTLAGGYVLRHRFADVDDARYGRKGYEVTCGAEVQRWPAEHYPDQDAFARLDLGALMPAEASALWVGLRAICTAGDGGPYADAYQGAGGGYEGLQAIARAALAETEQRLAQA